MAKPPVPNEADAADLAAGFDTKPSYTLKATAVIESAARCCAWTQGPTEARTAYVFRMVVTALVYPEALALFYDFYWRFLPTSEQAVKRSSRQNPLARGSLLTVLGSRYGSITRVAAPDVKADNAAVVVFQEPFFRGPPLGEVEGDDRLIYYIKESDRYAYGVWKEGAVKLRANATDSAYFDTASSMLDIMMARSRYEPALRYGAALDTYFSVLEEYVGYLEATPAKARNTQSTEASVAGFFARPPARISDETKRFMAAVFPVPGSGVAADPDRQLELLAQFDMPSLYIAAALRGVAHDGTARSNNQLVAMLVDLTGDAIAVCLDVAPRPIGAAQRASLSRTLLPNFYSGNSEALRRDMLRPWHERVQTTPINIARELALLLPAYGTIKSRIVRGVTVAREQVGRASVGKQIRRAGHDKRFDIPESEVAKTQAYRAAAAAGNAVISKAKAKKRRNDKNSAADVEASKRRADAFSKRKEQAAAQDNLSTSPQEPLSGSSGGDNTAEDEDEDDDEGRGDRLRGLSLFASVREARIETSAAVLAAFPPGYDSLFPANSSAAALAALPPSYLMPAPSMPLAQPSAGSSSSSSSASASVLSHLLWGSRAKSEASGGSPSTMDSSSSEPAPLQQDDQGGVVEMDADDQPSIPTPRASSPLDDGTDGAVMYYDEPESSAPNTAFVPPTPTARPPSPALRESYFFAEPAQILDADEAPPTDAAVEGANYYAKQAELFGMLEDIMRQADGTAPSSAPVVAEYDAGAGGFFTLSPGDFANANQMGYN